MATSELTEISQVLDSIPMTNVKACANSVSDKAVEYDGYLLPHKDVIQDRY